MNNKTILLGLVAISFVAGSIMTGTIAYGAKVDPLVAINAAIASLQARMTAVETVNTNQQTQINAISTTGGSDCLHNVKPNGDLSNCWLAGSFLYKADLADANFTGATVYSSVFQSANLTGVNFTGKYLAYTGFEYAILIGVDLDGANLTGTRFDGADLTDITYAGCTGTPLGIPAVGTLPTCP